MPLRELVLTFGNSVLIGLVGQRNTTFDSWDSVLHSRYDEAPGSLPEGESGIV